MTAIAKLRKKLKPTSLGSKSHFQTLRNAARAYVDSGFPARAPHRLALPGQPFDSFYLAASPLYRRSRELARAAKVEFAPRLVTSPRSLSSSILLENRMEYTPSEEELVWSACDPAQSKDEAHLMRLITYSTSVFHEQTHRLLWKWLPPPEATDADTLRRYLNFVEAIVIGVDMALGDGLAPELASLGYLSGVVYDPGSYARAGARGLRGRDYRNYLQAAIRATYLALEGYSNELIRENASALAPGLDPAHVRHAVDRALRLDVLFIQLTNPDWQRKNLRSIRAFFSPRIRKAKAGARLAISDDPGDFLQPYVEVEKVFQRLGI